MIYYDFAAISSRIKNDVVESQNSRLSSSKAVREGSRIWLLELSHNKMVINT